MLMLFRKSDSITSSEVERLFSISQRMARTLLKAWVESGFLWLADPAKKSRKYTLAGKFKELV